MKTLKFIIWVLIVSLFGIVIYQNWDFFSARESLGVNLFFSEYHSPDLPIALLVVFMFLFGWIAAYLSSLADRFRLSSRNKKLQQTIHTQQTAIDDMKREVAALKPQPETPLEASPAQGEVDAPVVKDDVDPQTPLSETP